MREQVAGVEKAVNALKSVRSEWVVA